MLAMLATSPAQWDDYMRVAAIVAAPVAAVAWVSVYRVGRRNVPDADDVPLWLLMFGQMVASGCAGAIVGFGVFTVVMWLQVFVR